METATVQLARSRQRFFVLVAVASGCTGTVGLGPMVGAGPGGDEAGNSGFGGGARNGGGSVSCGTRGPGPWSMRRLSRTEYNNTIADLLNDQSNPSRSFPPDQMLLGFDNNANASTVSDLLVEKYEDAAASIAAKAAQNPTQLLACQASDAEDTCAHKFIASFGLRALRRPLEADEQTRYVAFYDASKKQYGFASAVRMLVQAFIQAPAFLYRTELPAPSSTSPTEKVAPFELASRLSYLLWSSMPDAALFAAAAAGKLSSATELKTQARRMLKDPRATAGIGNLYGQWLDTTAVLSVDKDPTTFPKWTKNLPALAQKETDTFTGKLVQDGAGTINDLFRAPFTYANKELAAFYGVTGPEGEQFERVPLDAKQRSGILTQASVLATNAAPRQTNPVRRGYYVREKFLCAPPPPPPADLKVSPPPPDGKRTTRERFAEHRKMGSSCEGCHSLMDPVGLAFEHLDGVGLWRDEDVGQPVDATGELIETIDIDGSFVGVAELGEKLAGSTQVASCLVRQHFRFAFGRGEQDDDTCTLNDLETSFTSSGGNLSELLVALTQVDPFLLRSTGVTP